MDVEIDRGPAEWKACGVDIGRKARGLDTALWLGCLFVSAVCFYVGLRWWGVENADELPCADSMGDLSSLTCCRSVPIRQNVALFPIRSSLQTVLAHCSVFIAPPLFHVYFPFYSPSSCSRCCHSSLIIDLFLASCLFFLPLRVTNFRFHQPSFSFLCPLSLLIRKYRAYQNPTK